MWTVSLASGGLFNVCSVLHPVDHAGKPHKARCQVPLIISAGEPTVIATVSHGHRRPAPKMASFCHSVVICSGYRVPCVIFVVYHWICRTKSGWFTVINRGSHAGENSHNQKSAWATKCPSLMNPNCLAKPMSQGAIWRKDASTDLCRIELELELFDAQVCQRQFRQHLSEFSLCNISPSGNCACRCAMLTGSKVAQPGPHRCQTRANGPTLM
jgi:hypothetical protein